MTVTSDRKDESATAPFRAVASRRYGYHRGVVDSFISKARANFELGSTALTANDIREASFPLVKGGYVISEVDAALGRLEDALATRARNTAIAEQGASAWLAAARTEAQLILDHLSRPSQRKFARAGLMGFGYRVSEVDDVAERIVAYLRDGEPLTAAQVRSVAFGMQRGGYREEQVDALLDATVDVILAIR